MASGVFKVRVAAAIVVAAGLSLISGRAVLAQAAQAPAAQQAPAAPPDMLKLTQNVPTLLIFALKPASAEGFEAAWDMIRAQFAKSDRQEVKEFGATFTKFYKVNLGQPPPEAPVVYVFQLDAPSMTQSYNPGKIVYEFLYFIKDGKAGGIPREDADAIFAKFGKDPYVSVNPWPLMKIGS